MEVENQLRSKVIHSYRESLDNREEWRHRVNGIILTSSSTIFSIVISLNLILGSPVPSLLYKAAVLLNGLCILLQLVGLYGIIIFQDLFVRKTADSIEQPLQHFHHVGNGNFVSDEVKSKPVFLYVQKISYIVFALMIILYTVFALLK